MCLTAFGDVGLLDGLAVGGGPVGINVFKCGSAVAAWCCSQHGGVDTRAETQCGH